MPADSLFIMTSFPDFNTPGFNINEYNKRFKENNVIIHAESSDISYPEHWGCLSIKCAFNGSENYLSGNRFYAVNDTNYLVLNEGSIYSSYIFSETPVESFTINFSHQFAVHAMNGLKETAEKILEDFEYDRGRQIEFTEKLYKHDQIISPFLLHLYSLLSHPDRGGLLIKELYYKLVENLLLMQGAVNTEIQNVRAIKLSTRTELYRRLYYAKDYIDSCYMTPITLEKLAGVSCLNTAYFLRQFKNYFRVTPYQYIIKKRLHAAKELFENSDRSVTDVCFCTGYQDLTSFIKLFKKYFVLSPECYQKQFRKKAVFIG